MHSSSVKDIDPKVKYIFSFDLIWMTWLNFMFKDALPFRKGIYINKLLKCCYGHILL